MNMGRAIYQIIVLYTNIYMIMCRCHGGFIWRNRSCRPKECETPASFKPPQFCIDRNKKDWARCQQRRQPRSIDNKGVSVSYSGFISELFTGLVTAEDSTEPVINVLITSYSNRDMDLIVNMTCLDDAMKPGDPFYYWLPDQRILKLTAAKTNKTVAIKLPYRVSEPCILNCTHYGCYLYTLNLVPISRDHVGLTYYITVFNITKNAKLPSLSVSWRSAIAVAVYPTGGSIHVVFESIPSRLFHGQIDYLIGLYSYPENYYIDPLAPTYKITGNATLYTHTFHGIKEGEYYVEVLCLTNDSNPWSRSAPFTVPPINTLPEEPVFTKANSISTTEEAVNESHVLNGSHVPNESHVLTESHVLIGSHTLASLVTVGTLGVVVLVTVCIYLLNRKLSSSRQKRQQDQDATASVNEINCNRRDSLDENQNFPRLLEEEENTKNIQPMFKKEQDFLLLCTDSPNI